MGVGYFDIPIVTLKIAGSNFVMRFHLNFLGCIEYVLLCLEAWRVYNLVLSNCFIYIKVLGCPGNGVVRIRKREYDHKRT